MAWKPNESDLRIWLDDPMTQWLFNELEAANTASMEDTINNAAQQSAETLLASVNFTRGRKDGLRYAILLVKQELDILRQRARIKNERTGR